MSYGVLECDIVSLQNYMLVFCNKRFCDKKGHYLCPTLYLSIYSHTYACTSFVPPVFLPSSDTTFTKYLWQRPKVVVYCYFLYIFLFRFKSFFIFQLQLTYNIILVSGVYPSDQTLHNLLNDHPSKSCIHLSSYIVIRVVLTIFPMLYLHPHDYFVITNPYFLISSLFSPIPLTPLIW